MMLNRAARDTRPRRYHLEGCFQISRFVEALDRRVDQTTPCRCAALLLGPTLVLPARGAPRFGLHCREVGFHRVANGLGTVQDSSLIAASGDKVTGKSNSEPSAQGASVASNHSGATQIFGPLRAVPNHAPSTLRSVECMAGNPSLM